MKKDIEAVQRAYPQIYLACHADHVRARSNEFLLSARDSSLLAHLDQREPQSASALALHLGISPSTFSAAIARLISLGYAAKRANPADRREAMLTLTGKGASAMAATSVLDAVRVRRLLSHLNVEERRQAVDGIALLARAARRTRMNRESE